MNNDFEEYKEWVYNSEIDESRLKIYRRYFNMNLGRLKEFNSHLNIDGVKIKKLDFAKFLFKKESIIAVQLDYNKHFHEEGTYMIVHYYDYTDQQDIYGFERDKGEIIEYLRESKIDTLLK